MYKRILINCLILLTVLGLAACSPAPETGVSTEQGALRFDGDQAYTLENEFVTSFPNRDSGTPNNALAAAWVRAHFESYGWTCREDSWEVIDHSRLIPMHNVICELPGDSTRQILVTAHHDQAPMTVQGADNDGSGEAVMLHLADIFASEGQPRYTLTFVSTDGEEYGTQGSRRYLQTHPEVSNIIAGFSLDNLGKHWYTGMKLETQGQYRSYGALWLKRMVKEVASQRGDLVEIVMDDPVGQILNQAVPIAAMDHGPMVAAGIPAIGFSRDCPPEQSANCFGTLHTPGDNFESQDPKVLEESGRIAEASIRQLLSMDSFPQEQGPYLYFENSQHVYRGPLLYLAFAAFVSLFFIGSLATAGSSKLKGWIAALPHFLAIWIPLLAALFLIRLFVTIGLMERFDVWPGMAKDPVWYAPRWLAIILFALGLAVFLFVGRRLGRGFKPPAKAQIKSLALLVVGLAGVYILVINPFSLFLILPLLFWLLIRGRDGGGRALDVLLLLLGGLVMFAAIYFLGFVVWPLRFYVFWYLMMMLSIPNMIGIPTMLLVSAIIAAGLSMVIETSGGARPTLSGG